MATSSDASPAPLAYLAFVGLRPAAIAVVLKTLGPRVQKIGLIRAEGTPPEIIDRLKTYCSRENMPEPLWVSEPIRKRDLATAASAAEEWLSSLGEHQLAFHVDPGYGFASAKFSRDLALSKRPFVLLSAPEGVLVQLDPRDGFLDRTPLVKKLGLRKILNLHGLDDSEVDDESDIVQHLRLRRPDATTSALILDKAYERTGRVYGLKKLTAAGAGPKKKVRELVAQRIAPELNHLQPTVTVCSSDPEVVAEARSYRLSVARSCDSWPDDGARGTEALEAPPLPRQETPGTGGTAGTLYVWLGPDPSSTLASIWAHKPAHAKVFVDSANLESTEAAKRLHADAKDNGLPVDTLELLSVDFEPRFSVKEMDELNSALVAFNVSPGTRLQAASIAARSSAPLWSLDQEVQASVCLTYDVEPKDFDDVGLLCQIDVAHGLKRSPTGDKLRGRELSSVPDAPILIELGTALSRQPYKLGRLCNLASVTSCSIQEHREDRHLAKIPGLKVACRDKFALVSVDGGNPAWVRHENSGDWLEDLTAVAVAAAMRKSEYAKRFECRLGVELARPERILAEHENLRTSESGLAEIDVAARVGRHFFVFECKTQHLDKGFREQLQIATANAAVVSRFCVPVAVRPHPKPEDTDGYALPPQGAVVMDLQILLDPKQLLTRIKDLIKARGGKVDVEESDD